MSRKISDLNVISGAAVDVDADYLEIIHPAESQTKNRNKRITAGDLIANTAAITQSGSGAVASSVQAYLRLIRIVHGWIPTSLWDGIADASNTTDLTTYIQAAMDAHKHVFFPAGTYKCDGILEPADGTCLKGAGMGVTILVRNGTNSAGEGLITADSGSSSSYIDDITIEDMTIDGQVATLGFSDFRHLIAFHGVRDALVQRVEFRGYRGDGLYIASGLDLAGGDERHNINVTVRDCLFDGVNSDNRNGISVLDCDGLQILNNTFKNTTKSTMPGPIDVEPDTGFAFQVVRNIHIIGNRIESFSGGGGIIFALNTGALTAPMYGVKIKDNFITGATKSVANAIIVRTAETISSSAKPMAVEISGNEVFDSGSVEMVPFQIHHVRDARIVGNTFRGGSTAIVGLDTTADVTLYDIVIENNHFYRNGNSSGSMSVYSVDNLRIEGNTFEAPNDGAATVALSFTSDGIVTCASTNVRLVDNTFIKGTSQTAMCAVSNHTLSTSTNTNYGNRAVGGALTNTAFTADYKFSGFYQSGTWTPTVAGTGTAGTQTYTTQQGSYTRIGRLITVQCNIVLSAVDGGIAGNVQISGLPFNATNVSNQHWTSVVRSGNVTLSANYTWLTCVVNANTGNILIRQSGSGQAEAALPVTGLAATSSFTITMTYATDDV
jgi:hypothetical protein